MKLDGNKTYIGFGLTALGAICVTVGPLIGLPWLVPIGVLLKNIGPALGFIGLGHKAVKIQRAVENGKVGRT